MHSDLSRLVPQRAAWPATPLAPCAPDGVTIRAGTAADLPFVDYCQRLFRNHLGFMYRAALERKIADGQLLVVVDRADAWLGYLLGTSSYDRRDHVSRIDQIAVVPARQRRQLGTALLQAWIERLPYGVTLICCWCAQDLREGRFWAAEGFIPLAFRAGGQAGSRVHIFWERRTRRGDTLTPFWYPKETASGQMAAARLILPIPPGVDWAEVNLPRVLPAGADAVAPMLGGPVTPAMLAAQPGARTKATPGVSAARRQLTPAEFQARQRARAKQLQARGPTSPAIAGKQEQPPRTVVEQRERKTRPKNLPEHVAAARELRDRWLEELNAAGICEGGKYDPTRARELEAGPGEVSALAAAMMARMRGEAPQLEADAEE